MKFNSQDNFSQHTTLRNNSCDSEAFNKRKQNAGETTRRTYAIW